jgi:formylmethanofuran dehydrogenase subunit E
MGLLGGRVLGLDVPGVGKRLLTLVETDGCAADGVSVATGCTVGNRRMRVIDFGKVAATFVDIERDRAVRIVPRNGIRALARRWMPEAKSRWHAQLKAYKMMPDTDLLVAQSVELSISLERLLSKPGYRVNCEACGEEIINEREIINEGTMLCRACAGQSYYHIMKMGNAKTLCQQKDEDLRYTSGTATLSGTER